MTVARLHCGEDSLVTVECYLCEGLKVLPPCGDRVIKANPVIIPAL